MLHVIIKRKPNTMSNMTDVKNVRMLRISATCHNWTQERKCRNKNDLGLSDFEEEKS